MMANELTMATVVALLMIIGCDPQARKDAMPQSTCVFTDDSAPQERCDFVLRDSECFVQVAEFPGYGSRKWFYCPELPGVLQKEAKKRLEMPGEVRPPLLPGGVHFSRVLIEGVPPQEKERSFFKGDNAEVASWLARLRRAAVRPGFAVADLPEWVSSNPAIKRQLGFRERRGQIPN